jgi:hypothetical protein
MEIAKMTFIKEMILKQLRYNEEGCPCYTELEEFDDCNRIEDRKTV